MREVKRFYLDAINGRKPEMVEHPEGYYCGFHSYGAAQVELAALREELADMQHWRDLALQFDNHRMTALWHLKTLAVNPSYAPAVSEFLASPPLPASEIVQRLTAAEQRNANVERALSGLLFEFDDGVNGGRDEPVAALDYARTLIDAAEFQPTESGASHVDCGQCPNITDGCLGTCQRSKP